MKASAVACANQGLVKYWGKTDERLRLPTNDSISVCLDGLTTHTTVEFGRAHARDEFVLNGRPSPDPRIPRHLDLIRSLAHSELRARVESRNGFPASVGMASSASGFAALTVAATAAAGMHPDPKELSRIARRGSGSASRSIPGGFAELRAGRDDERTYAARLAGPDDLDFRTLIASVATTPKKVGSSEGMRITSETSPMFASRMSYLPGALTRMKEALRSRDPAKVAHLAEIDTLSMHACMLTSDPPLIYWTGGTIDVIREVIALREAGRRAFFSIDAGQNVFVNCPAVDAEPVRERLASLRSVTSVLLSRPGGPAKLVEEHLF